MEWKLSNFDKIETNKQELQMNPNTRKRYNEEFKVEAVKLVTTRGYSLTQAAKSLGVSVDSISE